MSQALHYAELERAGLSTNFIDESDSFARAHAIADTDELKAVLILHAAIQLSLTASVASAWNFYTSDDYEKQEKIMLVIVKNFVEYPGFFAGVRELTVNQGASSNIIARADSELAMLAISDIL